MLNAERRPNMPRVPPMALKPHWYSLALNPAPQTGTKREQRPFQS